MPIRIDDDVVTAARLLGEIGSDDLIRANGKPYVRVSGFEFKPTGVKVVMPNGGRWEIMGDFSSLRVPSATINLYFDSLLIEVKTKMETT